MTTDVEHVTANTRAIDRLARLIGHASVVAALTVPDPPDGIACTRDMNPHQVRQWCRERRHQLSRRQPDPELVALAELEKRVAQLFLITERIDGLHQKAGSKNVIELHGSIWADICPACDLHQQADLAQEPDRPQCPRCATLLTPTVAPSQQLMPAEGFQTALEVVDGCSVLFNIGAPVTTFPAVSLICQAKAACALIVEVGPDPTGQAPMADLTLPGPAAETLPQLVQKIAHPQPV